MENNSNELIQLQRENRILYLIARLLRNTDGLHPSTAGRRAGQLLNKLRLINGERYQDEIINNSFNSSFSIRCWVAYATKHLSVIDKARLTKHGFELANQGKLRGDISEYWVSHFPELKDKLIDLYL